MKDSWHTQGIRGALQRDANATLAEGVICCRDALDMTAPEVWEFLDLPLSKAAVRIYWNNIRDLKLEASRLDAIKLCLEHCMDARASLDRYPDRASWREHLSQAAGACMFMGVYEGMDWDRPNNRA